MQSNDAGAADLWTAMDLLAFDSPTVDPLTASYVRVPGRVKGSDPAEYAREARRYWLGEEPPVTQAGLIPQLPDFGAMWGEVKVGAAGILLALLVVAVGLLILYKSA